MKLPNGYGSVHHLGGKRRQPYRARVTTGWSEDGKQIYYTVGYYETPSKALQGLAEYHNDPYAFVMKQLLFKDVFELLIKGKNNDKVIQKDKWAFTYCKEIENKPFDDVKLLHLQKIINDVPEENGATRKRVKSILNQIYDFANANDISTKTYPKHIKLQFDGTSDMHQPFTKSEKQLLWDNVDKIEYVDIILVYIYTGFRPSELLDLKCQDGVNLELKYLQGGGKTEAGKNRIVPIHSKILPIIQKYYNQGNEYLFSNDNKHFKYATWEYYFSNIMTELNLKHTPYDTRHTTATDLDNVGANQVSRKRILGHRDNNVTDKVYTHKDIEELRKAINLLE